MKCCASSGDGGAKEKSRIEERKKERKYLNRKK